MSKRDAFREMYGNELADQVEQLKKKPAGVEVLRPKRQEKPAKLPQQPETEPRWWDR